MTTLLRKVYRRLRRVMFRLDAWLMGRDERKDYPVQTSRYLKPGEAQQGAKEIVLLGRNPRIKGSVQVVREGSADHLHSHSTVDGFWFVLRGRAIFRGEGDTVFGEIGEMEGILIPQNTVYRYESAGEQDLEILQVLAIDPVRGFRRQDLSEPLYDRDRVVHIDARTSGQQATGDTTPG